MPHSPQSEAQDKVAVIGMAGRFPGAGDIHALWECLCQGRETITFFSEEQLDPSISRELIRDPRYVKARGILEEADTFDADFFGIPPMEAEVMDPQARILLEVAWETFENAGYDPQRAEGLAGVFAGSGFNSYLVNHVLTRPDLMETVGRHQVELLNAPDYLATRISYKLDLKGPSISLYTGCSSSLVAVSVGVESLLSYQCDLALAGGVYIATPLRSGYLYQEGEMLSPDGHTRPFDAEARGTVFSSGAGLVLLKRLEEALADEDHIYAVIRGAALNNDGLGKVSFTAPSVSAQAQVIAMAQANAGITPDMVSYVEAHGTATPLGDAIELEALSRVFESRDKELPPCALGSIKGNIGHLDAAAGVAGLIKTCLALYHKRIPPTINHQRPHPQARFERGLFYVPTELVEWSDDARPRIAGVSSFGVGGTNAHVIVEEPPPPNPQRPSEGWTILPISAKKPGPLENITRKLASHLEAHPNLALAHVAHTLQQGRARFNCRRVAVCKDTQDASWVLAGKDRRRLITSQEVPRARDLVFMFSGQGSQYVGMGRELYQRHPLFRKEIDSCSRILEPLLQKDLRRILYPPEERVAEAEALIHETSFTQPALFTVEYALARVWEALGILPTALVGHSIGEYVAACLAGVFPLEDALRLVALRGRLIQRCPKGGMLAVFLPEEKLLPLLKGDLALAAVNGPGLCVASGQDEAVRELEIELAEKEIPARRLKTSHAFHSPMMDAILEEFVREVGKVSLKKPAIPYVSNLTGTWIRPQEATDPKYWGEHLRRTVRFGDALSQLLKEQYRIFLEVGPGNTLSSLAAEHPGRGRHHLFLSSLRHPKESIDDETFILKTLGRMWISGFDFDWSHLRPAGSRRIPLPTYAFEKTRHWIEPGKPSKIAGPALSQQETLPQEPPPASRTTRAHGPPGERGTRRDSIQWKLTEIWKKTLGYGEIGPDENYFELGGTSLMAVRVFDQIEKALGRCLPLATLYEAPTIRALSELLSKEDYTPSWASLVKIQAGKDSRPPIFCMHAEGGNVLEYYPLAKHLGEDQPFYGLQALGLEGREVVAPTIQEMASHFIREMKSVQPKGPYLIGGYCLGGLAAFEMAHQLLQEGEDVALIFLISTATPQHLKEKEVTLGLARKIWYRILDRAQLELDNLSLLPPKGTCTYLYERLLLAMGLAQVRAEDIATRVLTKAGISPKSHTRAYILQKSVDLSDDAYMAYWPRPLQKPLLVFSVRSLKGLSPRIELHQVPGFHKNIMKEPYILPVARILRARVDGLLHMGSPRRLGKHQET